MTNKHIILASKSPRRQSLIKELGVNFEIRTKEVEEIYPPELKKEQVAIFLSELKAAAFKEELQPNDLIITSDTIVCLADRIIGKPKDREDVISKVYNGLNKGGAFIFSEKTFSCNPRIQDMMTFTFYDYKRKNFSDKEILDKEVQLRHMMKLNSKTEIYEMFNKAGFEVHNFWQNFNFMGAIALKK